MSSAKNDRVTINHRFLGSTIVKAFVWSGGIILALTGLAKVWSSFSPTKVMAVSDPITRIHFSHLLLAVGVIELIIAGVSLLSKMYNLSLGLIAWLASIIMVYRLGLWWMGWNKPCGCLGSLTDALHISSLLADNIMKVILAYLIIGSCSLIFWQGITRKRGEVSQETGESRGNPETLRSSSPEWKREPSEKVGSR